MQGTTKIQPKGTAMIATDTSDLKKAGFWISNVFILIATVLGVYLAATQGFEQALLFDTIKGEQNNYYMRTSLRSELSDNVGYIKEYITKVEQRIVNPELVLETFVWDNMRSSSTALETPSATLREAQRFYRRVQEIMATPYYNDTMKAKTLAELVLHMEANVLPQMAANTEELRVRLEKRGITVQQ